MQSYEILYKDTKSPSNKNFYLHAHDNYEILLFLEGDTSYVVEGKTYSLAPGDAMLIRKHQLHRAYHNSSAEYKRIVINITPEFFIENHCSEYENVFINEALELDNKIPAELVKQSGLYDTLMRLSCYTDSFLKLPCPIYVSSLMEILYLLSTLTEFSKAETPDSHFSKIVAYINSHYDEEITLEYLSDTFFLSRYHLCRLFKQKTGMTIHQYINKKRFNKIADLVKDGMSITEAALAAGYDSYSAFYRVYVKEYGVNPRDGLKSAHYNKS